MPPTYHTKQQDELIAYLEAHPEKHHTAAQIREHLVRVGNPISTATIYRQLERFVQEGRIQKYVIGPGESACYAFVGDRQCASHFHCKCEICGSLIHLDSDAFLEIQSYLRERHGFAWDAGKTVFYGICSQCRKQKD